MNQGFVTVRNGRFELNGRPFRFVGTNAYYMQTGVAYGNPAMADDVFINAQALALGFSVVRTFAFANGPGMGLRAMQPGPGVYQESGFKALDYVLHKADLAGVRLILSLANGQETWGGPALYASWCGFSGQRAFYEVSACRDLYKRLVTQVLTRVNTYNGRRYADDPTVLAWELANEPHIEGEKTGAVTRAWVAEMAAHFQSQAQQLVSVGDEGFDTTRTGYQDVATVYKNQAWLFDGQKGLRWSEHTADPNIDFGSVHIYPEWWNLDRPAGTAWIVDHIRIARALGKPLVVGEFGWNTDPAGATEQWLAAWQAEDGAGALFWQLMPPVAYGQRDVFGVQYPPASPVANVLASYAKRVQGDPSLDARVAALERWRGWSE